MISYAKKSCIIIVYPLQHFLYIMKKVIKDILFFMLRKKKFQTLTQKCFKFIYKVALVHVGCELIFDKKMVLLIT